MVLLGHKKSDMPSRPLCCLWLHHTSAVFVWCRWFWSRLTASILNHTTWGVQWRFAWFMYSTSFYDFMPKTLQTSYGWPITHWLLTVLFSLYWNRPVHGPSSACHSTRQQVELWQIQKVPRWPESVYSNRIKFLSQNISSVVNFGQLNLTCIKINQFHLKITE